MNSRKKVEHLFICYTPLHTIISLHIIQKERLENVGVIYLYTTDSNKSRYYFGQIAPNAVFTLYIKKEKNPLLIPATLFKLIWPKWGSEKGLTIYVGNPKTIFSRMLIYALPKATLKTFDDGMGNIRGEGYFFTNSHPVQDFFFPGISYFDVLKRISLHYTIYEGPNIVSNTKKLDVFENLEISPLDPKKNETATVLLLTTLAEENLDSLENEILLYNAVIQRFKVTHYLAHPLNRFPKITDQNIEEIISDRIAEEAVMELAKAFQKVRVIGFYSSALLHLCHVEQIECINIELDINDRLDKSKEPFRLRQIETHSVEAL